MTPEASPVWRAQARGLLVGSAFALGAAVVYGANVPAARIASLAGMPGADLIFYRAILLGALAALAARFSGVSLRPAPGEGRALAILSLGAALTALLYLTAIDHLPVPMAVVIFYTFPLMIMIATPFVERRPLEPRLIGLFALAFAGLVLAIGPSVAGLAPLGVALALAAALTNTVLYFVLGRGAREPLRAMVFTQLAAFVLAPGFALLNHGTLAPPVVFAAAPYAIAAVILGYALGFIAQMKAGQRLAPARMGLLFLAEPATSLVVAALTLGEMLAPLQLLGVALMLGVIGMEILLERT